jgi:hypothetical protein
VYLTLTDAAAALGRHPATLRRDCSAGRIPGALRLGGPRSPWRIPVSYVDGARTDGRPAERVESLHGPDATLTDGTASRDYVTSPRTVSARARAVSRALVVDSRPAVGLRAALDGITDAAARHYPGRDGWCVACSWQYPCPDAATLAATVDAVAAAVLDGAR